MNPSEAQPVDATTLRRIAETVHAVRSEAVQYVVVEPPTPRGERTYNLCPKPGDSPAVINIPVQNRLPPEDRVRMTDLDIKYTFRGTDGSRKICDLVKELPDAVFWSESAVQKFMLPYYASKLSADPNVAEQLEKLLAVMRPRGPVGEDGTLGGGSTVIGLVHLPNSEYSTADLENWVGVLVCTPPKDGGEPGMEGMTLAEYLRRTASRG